MKLPCDICMWGLIPMIKRELVLKLHRNHKLSKTNISKKLGITKGSVTQYVQGKRAANSGKLRNVRDFPLVWNWWLKANPLFICGKFLSMLKNHLSCTGWLTRLRLAYHQSMTGGS